MIWNIVGFIVGGGIGWSLVFMDVIAYIYILHPEVQVSQYISYQIKNKQFKQAFESIKRRQGEFDKLTTRSALFQVVWVVLAVFTLSSVASWFGKALVMGLGLRMLVEEWRGWFSDKSKLKTSLFWQIKREVSMDELKWYLYIMTGIYMVLVWLLV
ncbi:MAG: hypothetical protein ABIJ43_03765 [Candidatus Beckwithbacteria bacterium]|nr:hypothetical protein [Patescibacteria group bacterium]